MNSKTGKFLTSLIIVVVIGWANAILASAQNRANHARHPFEPNEELVMGVEFSRALLKNVDVAEFHFTSSRDAGQSQSSGSPYLLKLTGEVFSKGFFAKLFNLKFRESMESLVEPTAFTVHYSKRIDEQGKRLRISEAVFADGRVSWTEKDPNNPSSTPRTADATFSGRIQDVLSAIYFLRTQPLIPGKTLEVTISDSGRIYKVPVRVVEKRRFETVLGRVDAIRVDPGLFGPDGMMNRDGHISIWYTNDKRRIPVKARIKTEYGTFNVSLKKIVQKHAAHQYVTTASPGSEAKKLIP